MPDTPITVRDERPEDIEAVRLVCAEVRVKAWDRNGAPLDFVARGLAAGTYQHEVDHLRGTIFLDRVADPTTLATWAEFDRYHLAGFAERARAIVARYGS